MATKTVTTSASCKHCGGTVIIEVTNVQIDDNIGRSSSGGVSSKMCPKCHQTSIYSYEIDNYGQFRRLS